MADKHEVLVNCCVTLVALGIAAAHQFLPSMKTMDAVALGLIVLAFLPWISGMVKSIKGPGGTELVFKDLQRHTQEAIGAAENANRQAELAVASLANKTFSTKSDQLQPAADQLLRVEKCIQRYNEIRQTMGRSTLRTNEMTKVVSQMIAIFQESDDEVFPITSSLQDKDRGKRLAAYIALYVHPKPGLLENLAKSVSDPDNRAFGQYWGIQAIGSTISASETISTRALNELKRFLASLDVGTDRHFALARILHDYLETKTPSGFIRRAAAQAGVGEAR